MRNLAPVGRRNAYHAGFWRCLRRSHWRNGLPFPGSGRRNNWSPLVHVFSGCSGMSEALKGRGSEDNPQAAARAKDLGRSKSPSLVQPGKVIQDIGPSHHRGPSGNLRRGVEPR